MPAAGVPAVRAFLSDTSLAIFAFLIAKIAMRGQQLQVCFAGCTYLFLLFRL